MRTKLQLASLAALTASSPELSAMPSVALDHGSTRMAESGLTQPMREPAIRLPEQSSIWGAEERKRPKSISGWNSSHFLYSMMQPILSEGLPKCTIFLSCESRASNRFQMLCFHFRSTRRSLVTTTPERQTSLRLPAGSLRRQA